MNSQVVSRAGAGALLLLLLVASCDEAGADPDAGVPPPDAALCGNGELDIGEFCDTAIAAGKADACPTACLSDVACEPMVLTGYDCQVECVISPITRAVDGDGCCPVGTAADADQDCGSCGDRIVGAGETCDPPGTCPTVESCSSTNACVTTVLTGSPDTCTSRCSISLRDACSDGDGCCPDGCGSDNDDDCAASCSHGTEDSDAGAGDAGCG